MRSNLAMMDGYLRRSRIESSNWKGEDLGFLGMPLGEEQTNVHNRSVTLVIVALLYQCLENYFDLVRIDSRLNDPSLEAFFDNLGSRRRFIDGMKAVRGGVFHVRSLRSWRRRNVRYFGEVCDHRGGVSVVISELRKLLYDFTEKVFIGELRIWSDSIYENMERLKIESPHLVDKLESGEIDFAEFMEVSLELAATESDED